jgi:cytochrome b involved in lipid metabolism
MALTTYASPDFISSDLGKSLDMHMHLASILTSSTPSLFTVSPLLPQSPSFSNTIPMSKTFSTSDVASHNKADNLWIIVDGDVYDLTKFKDEHPGGAKILTRVAGKDASKQFWKCPEISFSCSYHH